jgi:hypothetical protein
MGLKYIYSTNSAFAFGVFIFYRVFLPTLCRFCRILFDADPGWKNFGSGMEKLLSGIWDFFYFKK